MGMLEDTEKSSRWGRLQQGQDGSKGGQAGLRLCPDQPLVALSGPSNLRSLNDLICKWAQGTLFQRYAGRTECAHWGKGLHTRTRYHLPPEEQTPTQVPTLCPTQATLDTQAPGESDPAGML